MPEPKSTGRVAILERMYADIVERGRSLISAPHVSPTEIRGVYNQYAAILEETRNIPDLYARVQRDFEGLSTELRIRVRADALSHFQDLRILMGMLSYHAEASQLRGQRARLTTEPVKELPYQRDSVERRVAEYGGEIDPKIFIKVKPLIGQYVDGPTICKVAGYGRRVLYGRLRKHKVPTQGRTSGRTYLVNDSTILALFGKETQKPIPTTSATRTRGENAGELGRTINSATGDVLTFEQMLSYVVQHIGDDGQARVVELMEKHGDEIQVGTNRFLKAKLDELLEAQHEGV